MKRIEKVLRFSIILNLILLTWLLLSITFYTVIKQDLMAHKKQIEWLLEQKEQTQVIVPKEVEQPLNEPEKAEIKVCNDSSVKTYMDYRAITSKSSNQYKYIQSNIEIRDGFLYEGEYIGVALGSYFGDIGSKYIFTLDTGIELKVVKIEAKADAHTNNGCEQKWDKSVIEFVIDSRAFKKEANGYVKWGNFNNDKRFKGKIVKVEKE